MSKQARAVASRPDKLMCGLRNIHFAPFVDGAFGTPVRIWNAKSIECSINYENEQEWADDMLIDNSSNFAGGEGKINVLGLSIEEFYTLFSSRKAGGGIVVNSMDKAPQGAFLFERRRKKSKNSRLYAVYNCQCSPGSITAESIAEGKGQAQEDEITFSIGETEDNNIYYFIDTDGAGVSQEVVKKWFTEVQMPPAEVEPTVEKAVNEVKEEIEIKEKK